MATIPNHSATPGGLLPTLLPATVGRGPPASLPVPGASPSGPQLKLGTPEAAAQRLHRGEAGYGVHGLEQWPWEGRATLAVTVASAVELEERQIEGIARKMRRLTGFGDVRLRNVVDPSLIAGFVICYDSDGSQVIDLSVRSQLAVLQERIETTEQRRAELERRWR